jgi:2-amino-4-hydroxy-6-hydroxymethyldihydropteridine diphosphokinase
MRDPVLPRPGHAYVALGSNLDGPEQRVERAIDDLDRIPATRLLARSALYRTAPVGYTDQPDFVNAVALLETALDPESLLASLFELEKAAGRERAIANGPRTLDLDLLLHGDRVMDTDTLILPHPRMHERAFVLLPLAEIAPELEIPGRGRVRHLAWRAAAVQSAERMHDHRLA